MRYRFAAVAAGAAAAAAMVMPAVANASITPRVPVMTVSASTALSGAPDSGSAGQTWALDTVTRNVKLTRLGEVSLTYCPGDVAGTGGYTGHCYAYYAAIHDGGVAITQPGVQVPGVDGTFGQTVDLGVTENVPMWGWAHFRFYSDYKTLKPSLVPTSLAEGGKVYAGRESTGQWPELFFQGGAQFWDQNSKAVTVSSSVLTVGGWHYTAGFGLDPACPNTASRWTDSIFNGWGAKSGDGNIFAPASGKC